MHKDKDKKEMYGMPYMKDMGMGEMYGMPHMCGMHPYMNQMPMHPMMQYMHPMMMQYMHPMMQESCQKYEMPHTCDMMYHYKHWHEKMQHMYKMIEEMYNKHKEMMEEMYKKMK